MRVAGERLLLGLADLAVLVGSALWHAFLGFSLFAKGVAIAATLFAAAWVTERGGLNDLSHELMALTWAVAAVLLTWAVLAFVWTRFTKPSRYRR